MDDSEIVRLFWDRNENAISAAAKKHGKRCRSIAENILRNREDAEECVNDTYLKIWNLIPPNSPQVLGAFMCKIAKHTAIDMLKARHAQKRGNGDIPLAFEELEDCISDKSNIESTYERRELIEKINDFLRTLPLENRRVFILRYWYCCELSEIAERFGTRKNTISVMLNRTRQKLCEYLEKEGYEL